ncbi:MAG: MFS transporter [Galactobacter sp.]|uniref:MFS transporter n=1 Tax=Galactobacter sp. TaxID=2676125 RepID=UPI0025C43482|nr:MFS transporter [Galactobacter sp.]
MAAVSSSPIRTKQRQSKAFRLVMALCWVTVLFDGIDTFMYGATIPHMTEDAGLGMTAEIAGNIGSYATFGMLVGALTAGMLTDAIGRRKGIITCTLVFSLMSAVCALAPTATVFGIGRTLAGVGLGGLLPTAIAMVTEFATENRRSFAVGAVMSAHQAGGIAAGFLALWLLPVFGWRAMYWVGVLPVVLLVPLIIAWMPESLSYLLIRGRHDRAESLAAKFDLDLGPYAPKSVTGSGSEPRASFLSSLAELFKGRTAIITLLFWIASFGGLLLVYGFSTWLPSLMRAEGYDLGPALAFMIVTNLGGIFGMLVSGRLADGIGPIRVGTFWFLATAVFIALLSVKMPFILTYVVVFIAGFFLFSAQTTVYASVSHVSSTRSRASAIGWTTGMGRFGAVFGPWLGGVLFAHGLQHLGFGMFAAFAISSMVMFILVALVLRTAKDRTSTGKLKEEDPVEA